MPVGSAKSGLFQRLGQKGKSAFDKHKGAETNFGRPEVPAGITNGVAQLIEAKFDQYKDGANKGKDYFRMAAVIVSPKEHEGTPVGGLQTSVMEPLYDTPTRSRKNIDDHMGFVLNEIRKFGVDTKTVTFENIEQVVAALKESRPYLRFRTYKLPKQTTGQYAGTDPRTQHEWNGAIEYTPEDGDPVVDETVPDDQVDDATPDTDADNAGITEPEADAGGTDDLDELARKADEEQDADAATAINERAQALGIDTESIPSWAEAVTAIREAEAAAGGDTNGEAEATEPEAVAWEKSDMVFYTPPKTKKPIECEITAVFESKKTVNLKSMVDNKTIYKNVAFDQLKR